MLESTVYFESGADKIGIIKSLKRLPEAVRPLYFSEDEGTLGRDNRVDDKTLFETFMKKNPLGFFLYSKNKTCINISTPVSGFLKVTMDLAENLPEEMAESMLRCLAHCMPVFGYACEYDEYKHRHRLYAKFGKNKIEDWIGRDLNKYIPGLYWQTLLSNNILNAHNVRLADIVSKGVAVESYEGDTVHLIKFFKSPRRWEENSDRLDGLCERVEGVFSRKSVEADLTGASNILDYDDVVSNWR